MKSVKRFEQSQGLDTALYKNVPFFKTFALYRPLEAGERFRPYQGYSFCFSHKVVL